MSKEFAIGVQVVCVDTAWRNLEHITCAPVLGQVYTIREIIDWNAIRLGLSSYDEDSLTFLLEEIVNPRIRGIGVEPSFYSWHFKPAKKTDISTFTKITLDVPKPTKYKKTKTLEPV